MLRPHHAAGHEVTLLGRHGNGEDALATTLVLGVVGHRGTLSIAVLGNYEQVTVAVGDLHAQHGGAVLEGDAAHAGGVPTHGTHVRLVKEDGLAVGGHQDDLVTSAHAPHVDQLVARLEVDGNEAVAAGAVVLGHGRLLHHAALGGEHEIVVGREVAAGDYGRGVLALGEREHVHDCRAARLAAANGQLVYLQAVDAAKVGEEHHVVVGRRHKEVLDKVIVLEREALDTLAPTALGAVGGNGQALDVAGVGDGDHHVLLGDKVLDVEVLRLLGGDAGTALVGEALNDLAKLVLDDAQDLLAVGEKVAVVVDELVQLVNLGGELLASQAGELAQAHGENGVALRVIQTKALVHAALCLGLGLGGADDVHDLVDVVDGDEQALLDVDVLQRLVEVKLGASGHHVDLVVDVVLQHLAQRERAGHTVHQGDVDGVEVGLQRRLLVEVVEHHLRNGALLEVDDNAHALAVGLVAHVRDALDLLLVDRLGNLLLKKALVDGIGNLGNHQALAAVLDLLHMNLCTHGDTATAGLVGVADALGAHDDAARGEVGPGEHGHELVRGGVGVVDEHVDSCGHLAKVVGRHVGGHANGDARGAVHEEVGEPRRENGGLGERLVVVGLEVDGLLVEVGEHLHGRTREAALGVTHGRRGIAVDGAKVSVAVDEGQAHREVLRHADHRVVDGGVAVGVVLTHDLADRPGRLLVGLVGRDARLVHGVEDAPVDGLQAIAHVRQGARHDDRHGILEEGLLHLGSHVGRLERAAVDVGEVEAGACLVGDGVVEVRTGKMPYILGVIVIVVRVVILGIVVVLVFQLVIVFELIALVRAHAILEVILVVGGAVVPVVIVCHELPFSSLACSAWWRP